jgi:hypothetical protein
MSDVRWIALLPDPMTGFDTPVLGPNSKRFEWLAADKASARLLAEVDLTPNQFRLASIVSVVEFESREREPKPKTDWPKKSFLNRGRVK